jgi:hypothetical protein
MIDIARRRAFRLIKSRSRRPRIGELLDELGAGAMMRRFLAALAATIYSLSNPVCSADYSTSSIPQRRRMFASVFGSIAAGILSVAPRHGSAEIETLRAHD